jgi:hypothetical protein
MALVLGAGCLVRVVKSEGFSWLQRGEWGPLPRSTRVMIFGSLGALLVFVGLRYFFRGH